MDAAEIKRLIANAFAGVRLALKGKVLRATGKKRIILVQADGLNGESFNNIEFPQMPGYRGMPIAGMQPIIIPLNGKSANGVMVAMSNGAMYIADLKDGECALFNENEGVANSIVIRNGKIINMTCDVLNIKAAIGVNIDTPKVSMTHNLEVAETTKTNAADVTTSTTTGTFSSTSAAPGANHMVGDIKTDGDVIAGTISLKNHKTTLVQPGVGLGGPPQ
jgi:phage baseplate assembly protein V